MPALAISAKSLLWGEGGTDASVAMDQSEDEDDEEDGRTDTSGIAAPVVFKQGSRAGPSAFTYAVVVCQLHLLQNGPSEQPRLPKPRCSPATASLVLFQPLLFLLWGLAVEPALMGICPCSLRPFAFVVAAPQRVRDKEQALASTGSNANPQSPEEFDRRLMAEPQNSYLWIQYVAFFLQLTELDKARATARQALKAIALDQVCPNPCKRCRRSLLCLPCTCGITRSFCLDFAQQSERMNVWVAMLNLENSFGTVEQFEEVRA